LKCQRQFIQKLLWQLWVGFTIHSWKTNGHASTEKNAMLKPIYVLVLHIFIYTHTCFKHGFKILTFPSTDIYIRMSPPISGSGDDVFWGYPWNRHWFAENMFSPLSQFAVENGWFLLYIYILHVQMIYLWQEHIDHYIYLAIRSST